MSRSQRVSKLQRATRSVAGLIGCVVSAPVRGATPPLTEASETSGLAVNRAAYAIQLASTFPDWVYRRVETIEFPNADVVRRRMSIDFSLPPSGLVEDDDWVYVPVMILRKANLRNFDLFDGEGSSRHMLTTAQNRDVATGGLGYWLGSGDETSSGALANALTDSIGEVDPLRAVAATARELDGGVIGTALARLPVDTPTVVALRALVQELSLGFLLLVPMKFHPGVRSLVKFTYDASRKKDDRLNLEALSASDRDKVEKVFGPIERRSSGRLYWEAKKLLSQFGLAARLEDIENLQLGLVSELPRRGRPPWGYACCRGGSGAGEGLGGSEKRPPARRPPVSSPHAGQRREQGFGWTGESGLLRGTRCAGFPPGSIGRRHRFALGGYSRSTRQRRFPDPGGTLGASLRAGGLLRQGRRAQLRDERFAAPSAPRSLAGRQRPSRSRDARARLSGPRRSWRSA